MGLRRGWTAKAETLEAEASKAETSKAPKVKTLKTLKVKTSSEAAKAGPPKGEAAPVGDKTHGRSSQM